MTTGPDWRVPPAQRHESGQPLGFTAVLTVPALLSVARTAELLGCSARTVRRRIHAGELPAVVEGDRTMVRGDDLRDYIDGLARMGGTIRRRPARRGREGYDFLR